MKRTHQKRRSSWIDVTFSIAIIALTVSAIYLFSLSNKNEAATLSEKKQTATPTPVVIDTIDSHYPGIKIITETSNDVHSPFAIQYPQSLHRAFNDDISLYIKNAKQNYLTKMDENKKHGSKLKGELNISFKTLSHHSGNYSFVLVNSRATSNTIRTTEIRSFRLNPETGEGLSIADVFERNPKHLETLSSLVREALYNDPKLADSLLPEEVQLHTEPIWENFNNFAITDESITFYFDEYELTDGVAGPVIAAIPYSNVNSLLSDNFKLAVEDKDENPPNADSDNNGTEGNSTTPPSKETESTTDQGVDNNELTEELDSGIKQVALTFDDGPDPKVTMQILETLNKYDAKATFFMLGSRVEYYPEIAKSVQEAGHELGNHTWNHPDLTKAGMEKIRNEIDKTSSMIENVTGQQATAFRPPYGAVNETVRSQSNLPIILWDVDTLDWKHRDSNKLLTNVKSMTKNGSIILMHDIHQSTADGLDSVLTYLQSEGYTFVKVSELQ
ncbi:polysaccharide deacetylase family protein [Sporosarcina sp. JAI121]|uniref:polysaccharide deacetylase family protein n=1 Tax=Sporosarcina sp. JAI121 TaxID=2723064 RepID=UPI0015CB774A|nr:polysaccharide deacetylase family protein [Sporosarcina sp. JAI121]NYF25123.1 peptidoglycan/xylan/chitin deacetylase (PgdA/CDA1 family) [Sporosarcina sp. JAI121]